MSIESERGAAFSAAIRADAAAFPGKTCGKPAGEIHSLLKTAVEKPMFARKYSAKRRVCSFSTTVFHRVWITIVGNRAYPHPIYGGAARNRTKDGGKCPCGTEYFSTSKIYISRGSEAHFENVENAGDLAYRRDLSRALHGNARTESESPGCIPVPNLFG